MKANYSIIPLLFLFSILFSFSVNAYNSINQYSNVLNSSVKRVHVNIPFENILTSVDIIFEELKNENDNEDFHTEAFLILPFHCLAFNAFEHKYFSVFNNAFLKSVEPILISGQAFRI